MKGYITVYVNEQPLYVDESAIVSYQRRSDGVYKMKLADHSMVTCESMEGEPSGFVRVRLNDGIRYIAAQHIMTIRTNADGFGCTVKTCDGYVHKSDRSVCELLAQLDNLNRAK